MTSAEKLLEKLHKIVKDYEADRDWMKYENANVKPSFPQLVFRVADEILVEALAREVFGDEVLKLHLDGTMHIHKLPMSLRIPYCTGIDAAKVPLIGYPGPDAVSAPAKHLETLVDHTLDTILALSDEFSGAQSLNRWDLVWAVYAAKCSRRECGRDHGDVDYYVRQQIQRFVFECNKAKRQMKQAPFVNVTIVLDTSEKLLSEPVVWCGRYLRETYGEYIEWAEKLVDTLCDVLLQGDWSGAPFTFPIPTVYLHPKIFAKQVWRKILLTTVRRGSFYFLNARMYSPENLVAMCCRLNINLEKIRAARGIWSIGSFGSIGVVTLNIPRLTYLAKSVSKDVEKGLEDVLKYAVPLACICLGRMMSTYLRYMDVYASFAKSIGIDLANYYATVGVIGLPEAVAMILDNPKLWYIEYDDYAREVAKLEAFIVETVQRLADECVESVKEACDLEHIMFNVEQVPGESCAYRLAKLDWEKFPEMREYIPCEVPVIRFDEEPEKVPFYSTQNTPPYTVWDLRTQLWVESQVQPKYTGGVVKHVFLGSAIDVDTADRFLKWIYSSTDIVYISLTPTITHCPKCGWWDVGIHDRCLKCGSERVDVWSRIVGYYRPLRTWNVGRRAEFRTRKHMGAEELRQATLTEEGW